MGLEKSSGDAELLLFIRRRGVPVQMGEWALGVLETPFRDMSLERGGTVSGIAKSKH